MTVQTSSNVATGIGNGVTTVFPVGYKFNEESDLVVLRIDDATSAAETLTLNSDYTVQGAGNEAGGSVTMAAPLAVGKTLTITRIVDILQLTDLRNQGKFFAEVHEDSFDKFIMIMQQLFQAVGDSLQLNAARNRWDAKGRRIINVGDPVEAQDAVTKSWLEAYITALVQSDIGPAQVAASVIYLTTSGEIVRLQDFSSDTDMSLGASMSARSTVTAYSLEEVSQTPAGRKLSVNLVAGGRSGIFYFNPADLSAEVSADTQQGVYVAPANDPTGASGAWVRQYGQSVLVSPEVFVPWFGDIAGVNDQAACSAAIAFAGDGGCVRFPRASYAVTGLAPLTRQTWIGDGRHLTTIAGDGSAATVRTNPYPAASYPVRGFRMSGLTVTNTGDYALALHGSPDSSIQECTISSTGAVALSSRLSVRSSINKNRIISSGATHAAEFLNNCNGTDASNNTISGGVAGGGVVVGMTQTINLDSTVMEVCGTFGVSVSGNYADGGRCSGVSLRGAYFEQVRRPLELGLQFELMGVDLTGMYIGNADTSVVPDRDSAIHIGRVSGLVMPAFYAVGSGSESLIEWYDVTNGAGPTKFIEKSTIEGRREGYASDFVLNAGFTVTGRQSDLYGGANTILLSGLSPIGVEREWVSPLITANVAFATTEVAQATIGGGRVISIDVIDKTGDVTCTLQVGYPLNASDTLSVDPQTLTYSNRSATALSESSGKGVRPTYGLQMRTISGAGTGTFRVRVRYRV
ncbi:MAG: phage tail fiber protein [Pseudomonadota bacterium]|uniref:phage tail fiber domain-containing protein n=1 Tax=Halopseudomonas aestusnigri TaxID=857252 RepID=UPI001D18CAE6|nr:phage tail fiber protein [Halopseudomonas aestusnigri]MCC4260775.1 hypothetical protein [Halopseudomonas aestusnigri]MEC7472451.1 phage tail fiber protein [Pseudomonadota bacterium]